MASNTRDVDTFFQGECLVIDTYSDIEKMGTEEEPGKGTEKSIQKVQ